MKQVGASDAVRRAAQALGIALIVETVITIGHFAYGAHLYDDPGRLHVVGPAIVFLVATLTVIALFRRRPNKFHLAVVAVFAAVPYVGIFGLFHGAYTHALKDVLFFAGASDETMEKLFMSPDYVRPDNFAFESSGVLGLVAAIFVSYWLVRLVRAWRRDLGTGTGATATAQKPTKGFAPAARPAATGPLRLIGLAERMLFDAPFKSLGTLLGVVISVFLMAQQASLLAGILGRVTSFVNSSGVDVWIMSVATESTDATDSLPASKVGAAAGTSGVAWASPVVQGLGTVTRPDGVREYVKVLGVEAPRYAGLPRSLAPGTTPVLLRASGRMFLNWNDRKSFGAAVPGDRIEIDGKEAIISGFFQGMDPHSPYYYVYSNIDDARALTDFPLDRVTYIAVGVAPGFTPREAKANLEARIPEVLVRTSDEFSAMEERYFLVRTPVGVLFGAGTLIAAVIGAAIVAVTLYSTAVDRARDYGTLKAIGARQKDILLLLLMQAWIFFLVGFVIGLIAFFVIRHLTPELSMAVTPKLILEVAAASFVSCTLGSLVAVRRVLQLDPAIVFRG